jgi:hypothetical protein
MHVAKCQSRNMGMERFGIYSQETLMKRPFIVASVEREYC